MDLMKYFHHTVDCAGVNWCITYLYIRLKRQKSILGITFGPYILLFSVIQFVFYFNEK